MRFVGSLLVVMLLCFNIAVRFRVRSSVSDISGVSCDVRRFLGRRIVLIVDTITEEVDLPTPIRPSMLHQASRWARLEIISTRCSVDTTLCGLHRHRRSVWSTEATTLIFLAFMSLSLSLDPFCHSPPFLFTRTEQWIVVQSVSRSLSLSLLLFVV